MNERVALLGMVVMVTVLELGVEAPKVNKDGAQANLRTLSKRGRAQLEHPTTEL